MTSSRTCNSSQKPGRLRLLYIRDEPRSAASIHALLRSTSLRKPDVFWLNDPSKLDFSKIDEGFDLALIDLSEGDVDAPRLRAEARAGGFTGPAILVTDEDHCDQYLLAQEAGFAGAIPRKVLSPERLERWIRLATERADRERELTQHARLDPLTGLLNRRAFAEELEKLLARRGNQDTVHVFFADVDGFKQVNDRFGHVTGDRVLQAVGKAFENTLRRNDLVARLGGDEFAGVVSDVPKPILPKITHRLKESVAKAPSPVLPGWNLEISVGIFSLEEGDANTVAEVLAKADRRMYRAKSRKRKAVATNEKVVSHTHTRWHRCAFSLAFPRPNQ